MWEEALTILLQDYKPATNLAESTHQFETAEIVKLLSTHTGITEIDIPEVVSILNSWGFKYDRTGDMQLEWLLKKV